MNHVHQCDVLVIGAGPAGMAAACSAARAGKRVTIVDDNPALGGQIWRGQAKETNKGQPIGRAEPGSVGTRSPNPQSAIRNPQSSDSQSWFRRVAEAGVHLIPGARVFGHPAPGRLLAETSEGLYEFGYQKLILATGARERFLPFPGWTLPGVCGAGGLQALVKSGLPIAGKRVVIAGSGPLLMAVAAYLRTHGATVLLIAEQASWGRLFRFGLALLGQPGKILQATGFKRLLWGVSYLAGCWPESAEGGERLTSVTMRRGDRSWSVDCDYLACGFYLVPNLELAGLMACRTESGRVVVDSFQETSVPGVYCAGESTGIGGLELSLTEGEIAGYAAAGAPELAQGEFPARARHQRFADSLNAAFALRDELKSLARPDTLVCRCEDVSFERLRKYDSWRAAKLQTRCGMGPCQGRICGAATEFILGWGMESVRPPVFPVRLENMAHLGAAENKE